MQVPLNRQICGVVLATTILALVGCGPAATDPGPGGVNAGDAKSLDEAAKTLDERQTNPGKSQPKAD
jgi:hypothetical protein